MNRRTALYAALGVIVMFAGCASEEPKAHVSGKITFGGEPLPKGTIYFVGDGSAPEILEITNGSFSGQVTVGKKKIQINSYKQGKPLPPDTPGADEGPPQINQIPPEWNAFSTKTVTVKASGSNQFSFTVNKN